MGTKVQARNWLVDAVLYIGFLLCMFLDVTGLELHQWLGLAVTVLAVYHLIAHWRWVMNVTRRLRERVSSRTLTYYLLDAALFLGFSVIGITGVIVSTWLNLSPSLVDVWLEVHLYASIATLAVTVVKVGLHWRWIVAVASRDIWPAPALRVPAMREAQPLRVAVRANVGMGRREFLGLMGLVGVSAVIAGSSPLLGRGIAEAETDATTEATVSTVAVAPTVSDTATGTSTTSTSKSTATAVATSTPTATASTKSSQASVTTTCTVQCSKRCSYPGRCRKYRDTNGNKLCDLGECAA